MLDFNQDVEQSTLGFDCILPGYEWDWRVVCSRHMPYFNELFYDNLQVGWKRNPNMDGSPCVYCVGEK